jgi:two-component system chemotaxis response regulator CheY
VGDTLEQLKGGRFDLVLVNRKLDADYSDGIEIIRQIKADREIAEVPVMLVTNYLEHQDAAIAAGAMPGFGKLEYEKPETREKLAAALGARKGG